MRGNLPGPEGLARRGASAALHGLPVVTTTGRAARLASAPSPCQRGSRRILRQAPCRLLGLAVLAAAVSGPGLAAKLTDREHTRIEEPRPTNCRTERNPGT